MKRVAINNGFVVDPKNKLNSNLNILIENGKIKKISKDKLQGDIEIDAKGLIVCPGFVDIHMHEDSYNEDKKSFNINIFDCMVKMGVTTAIGGNCGIGPNNILEYLDAVNNIGLPVNFGMLVPHEVLRIMVNESNRYEKVPEVKLEKMHEKAVEFLEAGCFGISFGIRYIPGITKEELLGLSRAVFHKGGFITAHIRDDAENVIQSALEFINIGKELNISVHLSHIGSMAAYGQMKEFLSLIDHHKINGLDITADCYPYDAFSTKIGATTYDEGFLERYKTTYNSIEIGEGSLAGKRCTEDLFRKLRTQNPELITIGHVMKAEEVDLAIAHPNVLIASDGLLHNSQGHPRASGTFPRIISEYVRKKKIMSLMDAIEKMTYLPAKRLGINKGTLSLGVDADIVIFDYEAIKDNATFENPTASPDGIHCVIINGEVVVKDNQILKRNTGKLIKNKGV